MVVRGSTRVRCPSCKTEQTCTLVQTVHSRKNPEDKARLLAGELNVLACSCGKRTQLAANVLYQDPDAAFFCQVVPGGDAAMAEAAAAFAASGVEGTRRLVPSLNALVEKVKVLDAGLEDWAIEITKVLLLASMDELDRVLLFEALDRDAGVIRWVLFDEDGRHPERVSSPLSGYERMHAREASRPGAGELQIDRAWAFERAKQMVSAAN